MQAVYIERKQKKADPLARLRGDALQAEAEALVSLVEATRLYGQLGVGWKAEGYRAAAEFARAIATA